MAVQVWAERRRVVGAVLGALYGALVLAHAEALRAAGVTGKAPANAGAITQFVATITDNALWLIGTIATLAVLIIGGVFFFRPSPAPGYAARVAVGAGVIRSPPGVPALAPAPGPPPPPRA